MLKILFRINLNKQKEGDTSFYQPKSRLRNWQLLIGLHKIPALKHQHINRCANGNGFKPAATSANQPTLISIAGF